MFLLTPPSEARRGYTRTLDHTRGDSLGKYKITVRKLMEKTMSEVRVGCRL